jgi:arginyl-tRNA synthetase
MALKEVSGSCSFYNDPSINLLDPSEWKSGYSIKNVLKDKLTEKVSDLFNLKSDVKIDRPKDNTKGDYSTNIALALAKDLKMSPREVADKLLNDLNEDIYIKKICAKVEVAGAGFINFYLNNETLLLELKKVKNLKEHYASNKILAGKKIVFEYAHPNPFKAFHIGHLRNIITGESLIRLLENASAEVVRVNYQGDVGMHIAKCLWAFKQVPENTYPEDLNAKVALIASCYSKGAEAFAIPELEAEIKEINKLIYSKSDPEINRLWEIGKKWSLDKFAQIYDRVYSSFQREYMESEVIDLCHRFVDEAIEKNILKQSEGAVIFDGSEFGLETRVFLNSQGLPTYEGKELGLAYLEFTDWGNIDLCIHNVAVEQIGFFKVTFKVQSLLNPEMFAQKQYHNAYEFVGLKSGKMSSRTGKVVLGEEILNEANTKIKTIISQKEKLEDSELSNIAEVVGVGAIKYSFLNISTKSYLAFDLDKSISFDGDSGPYLQYTYARANRIVSKAAADNLYVDPENENFNLELQDSELEILKKIEQFEDCIIEATKNLEPNLLCTYLFDLAQKYNAFYKKVQVLTEEKISQKMFRIELSYAVALIIKKGLDLLGIKTVETM